jgi:F-type H+-transporting ATPase subunit delta
MLFSTASSGWSGDARKTHGRKTSKPKLRAGEHPSRHGRDRVSRPPRSLARRYARALAEVASAESGERALALRDELRAFVPQLEGHPQLRLALAHPALGTEQKRRLLLAIADAAQVTPLVRRLVELLSTRDRLALLPDVVEAYAEIANAAHGVVAAEVASAVPLAAEQRRALETALKGAAASVELRTRVEPALIGGLVVSTLGRIYDGSVREHLAALRRRLAASS